MSNHQSSDHETRIINGVEVTPATYSHGVTPETDLGAELPSTCPIHDDPFVEVPARTADAGTPHRYCESGMRFWSCFDLDAWGVEAIETPDGRVEVQALIDERIAATMPGDRGHHVTSDAERDGVRFSDACVQECDNHGLYLKSDPTRYDTPHPDLYCPVGQRYFTKADRVQHGFRVKRASAIRASTGTTTDN